MLHWLSRAVGKALGYSIWGYKQLRHGCVQATNLMSLTMELRRDVNNQLSRASAS